MTLGRLAFLLARLTVATFVILTAFYCLLAYIPFTYHQIHLGGLLSWVTLFAKYHPYFYAAAFVLALLTLPRLDDENPRTLTVLFGLAFGGIGVWLFFHPLLTGLENNIAGLYWCFVCLIPLLWMALLDWLASRGKFERAEPEGSEVSRLFRACLRGALYAWLLTAAIVVIRFGIVSNAGFSARQWSLALALSLVFHLALFLAIFLVMNFTGAVARIFSNLAFQAFFYVLGAAAVFALVIKSVVFAPLSFSGTSATWAAVAVSFSLLIFLSGTSARLYDSEDGPLYSPLELLLVPVRFLETAPRAVQIIVLLAASVIGGYVLITSRTMDWEYLVQKLILVAIWGGILAFFYVTTSPSSKSSGDALIVVGALALCLYIGAVALLPRWSPVTASLAPEGYSFLDEYANYDVGFRFARNVLEPPHVSAAGDDSLYSFLMSNTNIPRSAHTDPADIKLDGDLAPSNGPKPNIFIFVIDSLRSDYLQAYNPKVNFTPAIGAFASESVVVKNAFTHYTGTGLSEPSIWTGTMQLHKQYVVPYYPMNSLQKLLETEGYQQIIARDEILHTILGPSQSTTDMEAGQTTMNLKLCPALDELKTKLSAAKGTGRPLFSYMQPQDIHVSVVNKEHRSVPDGESYPGFDAAYASRVKAMDKCFGNFVDYLKANGLYDNSIVILTADHGDSLGERGLWGHAYNLVPETARIPIVVHLPAEMRSLAVNQDAPAFLTDITPSLYYLLGHRPIAQNPLFGRPLFTATAEESAPYVRSWYLLASSYAPVYGILSNDGHSLYVADGVEYRDTLYEWGDGSSVSVSSPSDDVRAAKHQQIRDAITEIDQFFKFNGSEAVPQK